MSRKDPKLRPILKFDFDGTITKDNDFVGFNNGTNRVLREHAKEVINRLHDLGCTTILDTCREGADLRLAAGFLKSNDIHIDYFNTNMPSLPFYSRKVFADYSLDDLHYNMSDKSIDFLEFEKVVMQDPYFKTIERGD